MGEIINLGVFKEWLIANNIFETFMINIGSLDILEKASRFEYISGGFNWLETAQGGQYWNGVNKNWLNFCQCKIIKKTKLSKKLYPKAREYKNYLVVHNC